MIRTATLIGDHQFMVGFIHLRTHSAFSLSEGAITVKDLVKLCLKQQMPAVALTDTGNLFGSMEFCLEAAKAGVQPIIGCQLAVKPLEDDPRHKEKRMAGDVLLDTLVFLVQSEIGYQNLVKLVSRSFLINGREGSKPFITYEMMRELHEGLIVLTGGLQGTVGQLLIKNHVSYAEAILKELKLIFDGRLYMEIARHSLPFEGQCEAGLLELAFKHDVPLVATNEVFFATEDMYEAHDALLCIAEGTYVHQQDRRRLNPNYRFKSAQEMEILFKDLPEALANTVTIAKRCGYMVEPVDPMLPPFPTPKGEEQELTDQAHSGLQMRLATQVYKPEMTVEEKAKVEQEYIERLEYELNIIKKMGFAGYYLIVADFIQWAKSQEIPVGPGRGSGAGSLVAWSLTITDIDPIRWNLLFERFLNPERISMPDFDVDFCQDRRDEVIDYVRRRYGDDRVAQIITFGKLQARAVVRDVGRVLGMPYGQVDRISKMVPNNNPAQPVSLGEAIEQDPQFRIMAAEDDQVARLLDIGQKLEGLYRHASTHAAGVVIGGKPLEEIVALYYDGKSALPATQYHMKHVELTGLVKFDFLGLKTLTVIQRTVDLARERGFKDLNISKIPLDDDKTFALLRRVEVLGVFQVESAGMRDVLRRLQPTRFEELIALVALYRPGPMDDIPRYLACKNGEEEVHYLHPMLEGILNETFGVMVYQEQVMQIAQVLGGYSLGSADLLRRAMGKKIKSEMDAQQETFVTGARNNGISKAVAEQIFDQAAKFAGYGFNKCHSGPYALIAYQTAYLKANFPVEFMAASMTYEMNNTDKLTIFREDLNRMQIPLLPPDVNKSYPDFRVEQMEDGRLAVRYALAALKNVGEGPMRHLIAERQANGPFKDVIDFARRLDSKIVNRRMLENLIGAGALDNLDSSRERLDASVEIIMRHVGEEKQQQQSSQVNLFGAGSTVALPEVKLNDAPQWGRLEKLNREFEAIGFYFSSHPLDTFGEGLKKLSLTNSSNLVTHFHAHPHSTVNLAGVVISKKERLSKKGSRYAFVQFSDATGLYEVTMFSEQYALMRDKLEPGNIMFMRVSGDVEEESVRLTVQEIVELDQKLASRSSLIEIEMDQVTAVEPLKDAFHALQSGPHAVRLKMPAEGKVVHIYLPRRFLINTDAMERIARIPGIYEVRNV